MTTIHQTNLRARIAILCVKIAGKSPERMSEVYDALNQRHRMRHAKLTAGESAFFNRRYMAENAPDLLNRIHG